MKIAIPFSISDGVLFKKLSSDKIKINWNKNPVRMDLFLSFLTVTVNRSSDHLGSCTGWTLLTNDDVKLNIGGGSVNGIEWLDTLRYGEKLDNPYNNFVNPFYLADILTREGIAFFVNYYKEDIENLIANEEYAISSLEERLKNKKRLLLDMQAEYAILIPSHPLVVPT